MTDHSSDTGKVPYKGVRQRRETLTLAKAVPTNLPAKKPPKIHSRPVQLLDGRIVHATKCLHDHPILQRVVVLIITVDNTQIVVHEKQLTKNDYSTAEVIRFKNRLQTHIRRANPDPIVLSEWDFPA